MKECSFCKQRKNFSEFYKSKYSKDGFYSRCKKCHNISCDTYRETSVDKYRADQAAYRAINREKRRRDACLWRANNPGKKKKNTISYRERHPETQRTVTENRRARKHKAGGVISKNDWVALCDKYGNMCLCCKRKDVKLTMDHVIPIDPGTHTIDNIQPLCQSCNSKKARNTVDYR